MSKKIKTFIAIRLFHLAARIYPNPGKMTGRANWVGNHRWIHWEVSEVPDGN